MVSDWWQTIGQYHQLPLSSVHEAKTLCRALLQILAAADEASVGVGVPDPADSFVNAANRLLPRRQGSTLCREIDRSRLKVLPKCHTPQTGISLRSLTHHLALWSSADVTPLWFPGLLRASESVASQDEIHNLNLLVIPWPMKMSPMSFSPLKPTQHALRNMPPGFGFFSYAAERGKEVVNRLKEIYAAARKTTDRIDGVVLPELAIEQADYEDFRRYLLEKGCFLIAGVGSMPTDREPGMNRVAIDVPITDGGKHGLALGAFQSKHHRWLMDRSQILQYGLGGRLDPSRRWWEYSAVAPRHLVFVSLLPWLSLCALVCEDLARQDPVGRLVRSVGPNLVIALLMDGPQLPFRWPARYATVLADDPGSSVLTVTSLGMCAFSKPPGKAPSRTVGLWKDSRSGGAIPIDLPQGASALLLHLVRQLDEEWSADGRSDGGTAGFVILGGVHPVELEA
jgi:hypothetical protein